ncbi:MULTISPECIES: DUF7033 domain-containing protein [Chitinophagaceae]
MKPILIYSSVITERLQYILDLFWKTNYKSTDSLEDFKNYIGPKISYSKGKEAPDSYWIVPNGLLYESGITQQNIHVSYWNEWPIFFLGNGDLPFDIFAASFYLITRYEEYLPHEPDQYGRFAATNALAFREKFLRLPLVDVWFQQWEKILVEKFPDYTPIQTSFKYRPTFDIDMPFAFLNKPLYIQAGTFLKNIFSNKKETLRQQIATLRGQQSDPFDTFSYLYGQIRQYDFAPVFFFPVAKKYGTYDKNPPQSNTAFQGLIKTTKRQFDIGIHPSWQSGDSKTLLAQEKNYLEKTTETTITKSRQHYIRMSLPTTYQNLIELGIREDYSMGYGNVDGFRASTSRPFYWFNLSQNKKTYLQIHPFCWMDATAYHHTKDAPEKALENLQYYFQTIQKASGQMITIMHNNYFAETPEYVQYRNMMSTFWQMQF